MKPRVLSLPDRSRQARLGSTRQRVPGFTRLAIIAAFLLLAGADALRVTWWGVADSGVQTWVAPATTSRAYLSFYLQNEMWRADVKTLGNMISYWFRPELPAQTNLVVNG